MIAVPSPHKRILALAVIAAGLAASAALAQPPAPAQAPAAAPATQPTEFAICSACHESKAGASPSLGPNLFGVGGRKAGSVDDYDYSPAMKAYGATWTADTLQAFLLDPNKAVPGNKMDYSGASPDSAKAVADYLMTLK
ncbi:cytochrome c family protein [Phenylobacterium sp.]|uniref:c-type cytochrome n=1 Tax=Phenylobacterium sp. TaxID=1871053 RepID=UPI003567056B